MSTSMVVQNMAQPPVSDTSGIRIYRGLPAALQDLQYRPGSLEVVLFWSAPPNRLGMDAFRIFQDNENNLIQQIGDRNARQVTIKMPGNSSAMFYVCAVTVPFGKEGPKSAVLARTNSDLVVVAGTSGSTPGTPSAPDPDWSNQSSGGSYRAKTGGLSGL